MAWAANTDFTTSTTCKSLGEPQSRALPMFHAYSGCDTTSAFNGKELFCHEIRAMEKLPPTQDALLQHIRRAVYQAGIWATSTQTQKVIPFPQDYGWTNESGSWVPVWSTIPEVSKACRELIKCSCKGDCSHCKCGKANLDCSPLCKCNCNT